MVHGLVGHPGAHGTVANNADHVAFFTREITRHGHAETSGNRGGGVRRTERDVFAFGAFCEARQTHPHPLVIHKDPTYFVADAKLKMKFVAHVNWKNRTVFRPHDCAEKIWRIMNTGDTAWPKGCKIGPWKGNIGGDSIEVPPLEPSQEADIRTLAKLPGEEKKMNAIWRIFSPFGVPFGDKLFLVAQVDRQAEDIKRGLRTLTNMGFAYEESLTTLVRCRANVERALNHLINQN